MSHLKLGTKVIFARFLFHRQAKNGTTFFFAFRLSFTNQKRGEGKIEREEERKKERKQKRKKERKKERKK